MESSSIIQDGPGSSGMVSLISLSYSMPVFSANSFGLFIILLTGDVEASVCLTKCWIFFFRAAKLILNLLAGFKCCILITA